MTIKINIPTSWDEIPNQTLKKVVWLLSTLKPSKKQDILLYLALQNLKFWHFFKIRKALKVLKYVPLSEVKKHYEFLFKDIQLKKFLPYLTINNKRYFAPGKRLHNITIEEFAKCEDLFFMYFTTNDLDYIKMLAAVLYRQKVSGQKVSFNQSTLSDNTDLFDKVPPNKLLTIAFSYKGSSLFIQTLYPNVFKKLAPKPNAKPQTPEAPNFDKVILDIAGGKFGNLEETKKTNLHDFLTELDNLLKPKK
jgi:hypothetical protein